MTDTTVRGVAWGPTGETVYKRTYRRRQRNGEFETWWEGTVPRMVEGNLRLVDAKHIEPGEREKLIALIGNFDMLPAGRHLSMSGVPGRQFLFNCWVAGWDGEDIALHSEFMFDQLMQGGGVGSNYSNRYITKYPAVQRKVDLHIVCSEEHPDYEDLRPYLSTEYSAWWTGAQPVDDSREGWYSALRALIERAFSLMNRGALVLDVTPIREKGRLIKTFGGVAAGPMPLVRTLFRVAEILGEFVGRRLDSLGWMAMDHATAEAVIAGGVRRSSRMSLKHWQDPDILDFVNCKQESGLHWSTNISVEVDDLFFRELRAYTNGHGPNHAQAVFMAVVEGMLTNGEPGFWNRTLSQVGEVDEMFATNPCGEIVLPQWGNCNLGHINLQRFFGRPFFDLAEAHRLMTRLLIRATFGDVPRPEAQHVLERERRIGVGHFGFAGWLAKCRIRYSEAHHTPIVRKTLRDLKEVVDKEKARYASQLRIPVPIKGTTLAPTGSVAKLPGATESLEAVKFRYFINRIRFSEQDPMLLDLKEQGYHVEPDLDVDNTVVVSFPCKNKLVEELEELGFTPDEIEYYVEEQADIDISDLLAVQQMYQELYVDNAISHTITLRPDDQQMNWIRDNPRLTREGHMGPPATITVERAANIIRQYLPHLKGVTFMVEASRPQMPQERLTRLQYEAMTNKGVGDDLTIDCTTGACPIPSAVDDYVGVDA